MEKIDNFTNNCTLIAVREVTRLSDEEILTAFRKVGYVDNKGMRNSQWTKAAQMLGCKLSKVDNRYDKVGQSWRERMTLAMFCREYPYGTYFVSVSGHALVIRDGKIIDHNYGMTWSPSRKVVFAHRVVNAPEVNVELTEFLEIPYPGAKKNWTKSGMRFWCAASFIRDRGDVTLEDILRETPYTMADFKHDLKERSDQIQGEEIMTRINCIPVKELHDKHLVAEYRELPRVFTLAMQAYFRKNHNPADYPEYVLGAGHVKFFYDKLGYCRIRFMELAKEMRRRGFSPDPDLVSKVYDNTGTFPDEVMNNWTPTEAAEQLNRQRINERLKEMKS